MAETRPTASSVTAAQTACPVDSGDDLLVGGSGVNTLLGGSGDDTFRVQTAGDSVLEAVGGGSDKVLSAASFTLGAGQEIEELTLNKGAGALAAAGNELDNTLRGNSAGNTLFGGSGTDELRGLLGDDLSYGGSGDDLLLEFGGADSLYGGDGADRLFGGGGIDLMVGGSGDDSFRVDNAGDVLEEAVGGGDDRVTAFVNFTLAADQELEELILADAAVIGTGNSFDNRIRGASGSDLLSGRAAMTAWSVAAPTTAFTGVMAMTGSTVAAAMISPMVEVATIGSSEAPVTTTSMGVAGETASSSIPPKPTARRSSMTSTVPPWERTTSFDSRCPAAAARGSTRLPSPAAVVPRRASPSTPPGLASSSSMPMAMLLRISP